MTWDRRGRGRPFSYSTGSHPRAVAGRWCTTSPELPLPDVWGLWPRDFAEGVDAYAEAQGVTRAEVFRRISAITGNAINGLSLRYYKAAAATPPDARGGPVGTHWGPTPPPSVRSPSGLLRK